MSTPNKYDPPTNTEVPKAPCCPHCGHQLDGLGTFNWQHSAAVQILACHCSNDACRKVLHMQIVFAGVVEEAPRIQRPH